MVQIVIRGISGGVKDLPLQFDDENTTVLKVKQSISEQYPGNPSPSTQKLIFAGRLLQEETTLADIFKLFDKTATQIFYLKISSAPAPQQQAQQQQQQQQSTNANIPQPNGFNPGYPAPQFYAQFRMGVVPPNQQFGNFPNMNNPYMRRPPQFYGPNQPNNGWQQQPQQNFNGNPMFPQQPQPPRPAPANDGEGTNQFYLLLKMVFLVYILSQGGSTTRTLMLGVGALIAFLYQTGRLQIFSLGPNQGQAQQPRNQPNPNANNPQPQPQQQGVNNNDPAQQNPNNQIQQVPAQTGIVGAVMPFFYSLLPSWNPGVQPNLVPPAPNRGVDNVM